MALGCAVVALTLLAFLAPAAHAAEPQPYGTCRRIAQWQTRASRPPGRLVDLDVADSTAHRHAARARAPRRHADRRVGAPAGGDRARRTCARTSPRSDLTAADVAAGRRTSTALPGGDHRRCAGASRSTGSRPPTRALRVNVGARRARAQRARLARPRAGRSRRRRRRSTRARPCGRCRTTSARTAASCAAAGRRARGARPPTATTRPPRSSTFDGRLAWRVQLPRGADAVYDATSTRARASVLRRVNMVKSETPALVWERFPGSGAGGTAATVDLERNGWLTRGRDAR